jgi:hypothetical protein
MGKQGWSVDLQRDCERLESMNEAARIKVGDLVCVNFNNAQYTLCSKANVLAVPCATGDSWVFEDCKNGKVHYVSEGCTITKLDPDLE